MGPLAASAVEFIVDALAHPKEEGKRARRPKPTAYAVLVGLVVYGAYYVAHERAVAATAWIQRTTEAITRFEQLERRVAAVEAKVDDMHADVVVIRDGLIRRGLADARPEPVFPAKPKPPTPWAFSFIPEADAEELHR